MLDAENDRTVFDEIIDRLKQQQESVSLKSDIKVMLDNYFKLYEEK